MNEESPDVNKNSASNMLKFWRAAVFVLLGVVIFGQIFAIEIRPKIDLQSLLALKEEPAKINKESVAPDVSDIQKQVLPQEGVMLPITWGDLGERMVGDGVIDEAKFKGVFANGLKDDEEDILSGNWDKKIVMTQDNSHFLLNMLWAFGLANKNEILESGEMVDKKYGGDPSKYASTGGWSLMRGEVMNHYSKHSYVVLTTGEQEIVDRVSRGIFRPCCGNSTHFPDCNHGMAMLGLLELMAANGASEYEMYKVALKVNSFWFPQTYIDLATYFKEQGVDWSNVDPKLVLGSQYSSAQGYKDTRLKIQSLPKPATGGGGCGA
ncbi:hypothetical protein A2961_03710 [Candidatus Woesebacteria bacterium RIFCSPLOWO2_01_FULL_39_21]|uniref:Uncharacterized protein n=1 Tax=Candidatus Woesebacteria bacterium RIFCSPLOWO2_01_FULL_39_21 TaxID=1802519 RepID=A0A1F8BFT0_9BACT|nr:MAG: hypothetical protein A2691_03940 [Candidatus Woesebacteria bacterium RIFCSPHIGHO2_01_FULL_39_23]OGM62810.1 MAG: hypothetical protein A2961_03710 [Candidatus Woesebacteria bacterium RIFCSPLOWO2_01_FULL_39_21]